MTSGAGRLKAVACRASAANATNESGAKRRSQAELGGGVGPRGRVYGALAGRLTAQRRGTRSPVCFGNLMDKNPLDESRFGYKALYRVRFSAIEDWPQHICGYCGVSYRCLWCAAFGAEQEISELEAWCGSCGEELSIIDEVFGQGREPAPPTRPPRGPGTRNR
jgi:hypothetical protein